MQKEKIMTQKEIIEYNRLCAKFLGGVYHSDMTRYWFHLPVDWNDDFAPTTEELKFHSDWNWIHEVKEKICQLSIVDEFNTQYDSVGKGFYCSILPAYKNTFDAIYTDMLKTEKEAVVQAINQFLICHKNNKKLCKTL